jgi:hypothetical protein
MDQSTLAELINDVEHRFNNSAKEYPRIPLANGDEKLAFLVSHSAHHMYKVIGQLAAECEAYDHGGSLDLDKMKTATAKMLVNVLKLSSDLGLTPEALRVEFGRLLGS